MKMEAAKTIVEIAMECSRNMDASIQDVKDSCRDDVFQGYRRTAGRIMGFIFTEVLGPIWTEHAQLAPEWFRAHPAPRQNEIDDALRGKLLALMDSVRVQLEKTSSLASGACVGDASNRYREGLEEIFSAIIDDTKAYVMSLQVANEPETSISPPPKS